MRSLFAAWVAVCLAGIAGAVTVSWAETPGAGKGYVTLRNRTDPVVLSLRVTLTEAAWSVGNAPIFTFGALNGAESDENYGLLAYAVGGKAQLGGHFKNFWTNWVDTPAKTYDVAIRLDRTTTHSYGVTLWIDGIKVGGETGKEGVFNWQKTAFPSITNTALGLSGNTFEVNVSRSDAFSVSDLTVVQLPEPCASALLLLGVGLLGLHRR